jgi:predicted NBD/HSP70 family sugar kinase
MEEVDARQRELLRLLWREGRLSRWELHQRTGVNPNAIGLDVGSMLSRGLVRECQSEPLGPGRPRVPLEIDLTVRHVLGLAISPGRIKIARLNLRGNVVGKVSRRAVNDPSKIVPTALDLLQQEMSDQTLAIGLSVVGFVDPEHQEILSSATLGEQTHASLAPIYAAAGGRPVILENNMHAFAAQWLLTHQAEADEDVILVRLLDGELGAALLVDGRPNRGSIIGASELGHTRLPVDTDPCYCGSKSGCLERICSTGYLRRNGIATGTLMENAAAWDGNESSPVGKILNYFALGMANAVNFIRPNRLVLVTELTRRPIFHNKLVAAVRSHMLGELVERVRIDVWDNPELQSAEPAGWLALANLYREGWNRRAEVAAANGDGK